MQAAPGSGGPTSALLRVHADVLVVPEGASLHAPSPPPSRPRVPPWHPCKSIDGRSARQGWQQWRLDLG